MCVCVCVDKACLTDRRRKRWVFSVYKCRSVLYELLEWRGRSENKREGKRGKRPPQRGRGVLSFVWLIEIQITIIVNMIYLVQKRPPNRSFYSGTRLTAAFPRGLLRLLPFPRRLCTFFLINFIIFMVPAYRSLRHYFRALRTRD